MENIYQFSTTDLKPDLLICIEIQRQEELLKSSIWYHGIVGRVEAEYRIMNNGEFLVRLSQDYEKKFVVTTKWNGKFIHTIIKQDVNKEENNLEYFINKKFKFPSILDLIIFHKDNQYPLSETSGAVLYKPVDSNVSRNGFLSLRESKFRKSANMFRKHTDKRSIPRSGSETYLTQQRYSDNFPEMNKSLTNINNYIDSDAPSKPKKPSFKFLSSKHLLLKLRPSNIKIRNKKLYRESSDYTDYSQVKDTEDAMIREEMRRGISFENRSPSLFGLNTVASRVGDFKKHSIDESVYVACTTNNNSIKQFPYSSHPDDRDSTVTLRASSSPIKAESNDSRYKFDIYGLNKFDENSAYTSCATYQSQQQKGGEAPKFLGLSNFINFDLSFYPVLLCGQIATGLDKQIINKVSAKLLDNTNNYLVLCKHLVVEFRRIFSISCTSFSDWNIGYRTVFLPDSGQFQRDLLIRQTALTHFVMATIVSTISTEKRIALIFFWIRCAHHLLTHVHDMFHFRSIFSAIFSDQILNLRVWKIVHRQDPSLKLQMEVLKEAIKNGCLMRTDISLCIPDLVQLGCILSDNDENLDVISKISLEIAMWTNQSFNNPLTWLMKVFKDMESIAVAPFFREVVQTEILLCMIIGKSVTNYNDVTRLLGKVNDRIDMMAKVVNETQV